MAVRLRLRRVGRKKLPIYKVVAADRRSPRDGRYIEAVGQYEPLRPSNNVEFNEDRVMYWLQNGALPTDTVRNLLQSKGLWLKWSLVKKGADENTITQEVEKFKALRAEKVQEVTAKKKEEKPVEQPSPEVQDPQKAQTEQPAISEEEQGAPEQAAEKVEEKVEEKEKAQDNTEATESPEETSDEQKEDTEKKE